MAIHLQRVDGRVTLQTLKPSDVTSNLRLLVFGPSGVGKTRFVSTAADVEHMKPILLCDSDRGLRSVADRDDIDVVQVDTYRDMEQVIRYIRSSDNIYRTLILDGLTSLYMATIRSRLEQPTRQDKSEYVPELQDWLHGTFIIRRFVQQLKTANIHFLATALEDEYEVDVSGVVKTLPALSSKLSKQIGGEFDVVMHMDVVTRGKAVVRRGQLHPFGRRTAKVRSTFEVPPIIEEPNMAKILHLLNGIEQED